MEVILLEKIGQLGNLGDKVNVKPGFGRNYLIPQGKAVFADADNLAEFQARRAELEKKAAEVLAAAETRAEQLRQITVKIVTRASDEGKLFGSVGTQEIARAVTESGVQVDKHEVRLPEGVIRQTGQFEVGIQLHSDVMLNMALTIEAE